MNDPMPALSRIAQFENRLPKVVYSPGATIFTAGHRGNEAYIVRKGEVQIFSVNAAGERNVLSTVLPGQMFGELALMNERIRTANARTETGCDLLIIKAEQIQALLDNAAPFLRFWIEYLSNRVIDLSKRVG